MTTTFSSFVDDVIADYSLIAEQTGLQDFQNRIVDQGGLVLARELNRTQRILDTRSLGLIPNTVDTPVVGSQKITFNNIYQRKALGTATIQQRIDASATQAVYTDNALYFDGVADGFRLSRIADIIRDSGGTLGFMEDKNTRAYKASKAHFVRLMTDSIRTIYERINAQIDDYIFANRWQVFTLPDAGVHYLPVAGEFKRIPVADTPTSDANTTSMFLAKLKTERKNNAFGKNGRAILYHTTKSSVLFERLMAFGEKNNFNDIALRNYAGFSVIESETLDEADPTDTGTMYMIDGGSTVFYQRAPTPLWQGYGFEGEMGNGYTVSNDTWATPISVGEGTSIFPNFPKLTLSRHIYQGWQDSTATYNTTDAHLDRLGSVSFYVQCGMHTAKNLDNPAETSIVGYRVF